MNDRMSLKEWLPLIGMTFSAFIFNTSEFMPIGLLSDIAADFHMTEAGAGMLISVYAWIVMLLSLPLMLLVCRMEMRKLLLCTVLLFSIFQFFSSISTGYGILMASRIGVACTHAVFWSIASPMAVRFVPEKFRSLALGMIVTGTSIAMIVGLPLGRVVGLWIGWRMTFLCVALLSLLIFLYLCLVAPRVPGGKTFSVRKLPQLLNNPLLITMIVITLLTATSYYTGYSYIEPFLKQVAGLNDSWITTALMLFGASGLIGSLLFSRYYDKSPALYLKVMALSTTAALLLMRPSAPMLWAVLLLCIFWGTSITAYGVAFQAEVIDNTPQEATAVAMSIYSGIFNLGIGCGSLIGGMVCTYSSIANIGYVGGAIGAIGTAGCILILLRLLKKKNAHPGA